MRATSPQVESGARRFFRIVLAVLYAAAGVLHLLRPGGFLAITPHWVPMPAFVVEATGVAEIAGAIGLITRRWRWAAGIGLALYALCVFPANINHAVNQIALGGRQLGWGYHAPRLMLQVPIIWWALWAGGVTDWPFRRRRAPDGAPSLDDAPSLGDAPSEASSASSVT